jgi:hypothetical protein
MAVAACRSKCGDMVMRNHSYREFLRTKSGGTLSRWERGHVEEAASLSHARSVMNNGNAGLADDTPQG